MDDKFDAIIVGAGLAGSAAALKLAQAGLEVVLVERGPYPGSKIFPVESFTVVY